MTEFTKENRYKVAAYLCYYLYKFSKKYDREDTLSLGTSSYYNDSFRNYIDSQHYL